MTYTFTATVVPHRLNAAILASALAPKFYYIDTVGSTLNVHTHSELSSEEQASLVTLVAADTISGPDMQAIVKGKILAAMDFGRDLMAEYGASNVLAGLTVDQVKQIMTTTTNLQAALTSGSLYVALDEIALIGAPIYDEADGTTVIISADKITVFRNKIQAYLGIALT